MADQQAVVLVPYRAIGTIQATATVEEVGVDELVVTEHPVEQGASITDHAYARPARVSLRVAWSNSDAAAQGDPTFASATYAKLLKLQQSRQPFILYTGKRVYPNMLIQSLSQTTDKRTENALFCTVVCQQILIASTSTFTVSTDQTVLADPSANAPTVNTGQKQAAPTSLFNGQAVGSPSNGEQIGP